MRGKYATPFARGMPEPVSPPVELYHRDEGQGPIILLLHGLGGDHRVWNTVLPALAKEFRVLAPDLRGHGRSPAPAGSSYSFAELEGDLRALLEQKKVDRCHVVGLSAGGFLALQFALDDPARFQSLVLVGSSSHCDAHSRAVAQNWAETYRDEGYDAYALRLLKDLFYPDWIEAHFDRVDALREERRGRDLRGTVAWGLAVRTFDLRGRVGRIRLPTLILQGMDDQVIDAAHGRLLRQSIIGAELKLFARTGHMVPIERPGETVEALSAFVHRVESAVPPA